MKATRILLISGLALLAAVFVIGIYVVPRAQSGSPQTARQSDAARVPISDVYLDVCDAPITTVGAISQSQPARTPQPPRYADGSWPSPE